MIIFLFFENWRLAGKFILLDLRPYIIQGKVSHLVR